MVVSERSRWRSWVGGHQFKRLNCFTISTSKPNTASLTSAVDARKAVPRSFPAFSARERVVNAYMDLENQPFLLASSDVG